MNQYFITIIPDLTLPPPPKKRLKSHYATNNHRFCNISLYKMLITTLLRLIIANEDVKRIIKKENFSFYKGRWSQITAKFPPYKGVR